MTEYMRISGVIRGSSSDGKRPMTEDEAASVANLLATDATYGTFGDFPPKYWAGKLDESISKVAIAVTSVRSPERGEFGFHLDLSSEMFDPAKAGMQHLLGVLAGDLLTLQVEGLHLDEIRIEEVEFPETWQKAIESLYRKDAAHTVHDIRSAFRLEEGEPLLAFSVKPRMGLKPEALREITLGVLRVGFHIVELDTRSLDLNQKSIEVLAALVKEASNVGRGDRITRFSPNLSAPPHLAAELCEIFREASPDPFVVKVDGGLDGISTCQKLRTMYKRDELKPLGSTPFVTTYPLLRRLMQQRVADDTFLKALIWSGSDIIYPGGAPNLGGAYRRLDHAQDSGLSKSVARYIGFIRQGYPMPTVAGGIYPGQLQAYYELLGPDVAYFFGGGVALHNDGPIAGAKLCCEIVKRAQEARNSAKRGEFAENIPDNLIQSAEASYPAPKGADPNTFRYLSPREDLQDAPGLKPWFMQ
jgi:ribulose 1,5-bisphosphate carboxylase large subunit-like protein